MNKTLKEPLRYKLLTYIAYSLVDGYIFSYVDALQTIRKYFGQTYQISTLRKEYSLLKKDGFIELRTHYRKPYPILTQRGRLSIKTRLPYKQYDPWDGKWRMVSFDIPERVRPERLVLVRELLKLGFAPIQKSTFISAHPLLGVVSRFATDLGTRQFLRLFEVEKIDNEKETMEAVWNLKEINSRYLHFLRRAKIAKDDRYWPLKAKRLELEFVQIYEADPHLPAEFLPNNWAGSKAYLKFKALSNSY